MLKISSSLKSRTSALARAAGGSPASAPGDAPRSAPGSQPSGVDAEAIKLIATVAEHGSFAAAARVLGLVPSAVTWRVRRIEEALDVLLFDRAGRKAVPTAAGLELVSEGARILADLDAVATRVKRIATGWEPQLTIAVDSLIVERTVLQLAADFLASNPPTQLKLQSETLSGTWDALVRGEADLALGVVAETRSMPNLRAKTMGDVPFVFAVAPHHPLAALPEPLSDALISQHRAVAVADSIPGGSKLSVGLLPGQAVLTVSDMRAKVDAQLRGIGCGFVPECVAQPYIEAGRLVQKRTARSARVSRVSYAWREGTGNARPGRALTWWLKRLSEARTLKALLYL
jgi:DNA-binding transcriptional LysR family regulator